MIYLFIGALLLNIGLVMFLYDVELMELKEAIKLCLTVNVTLIGLIVFSYGLSLV